MAEYRVEIPDEVFAALEWEDKGLPAICAVNQSLANFEPKIVFAWHSMADLYWEMGRREVAKMMLQECADRFRDDSHCALRRLSLQAATDLSICWFEDGDVDRALSTLTEALVACVSDTEVNVQEEFCRAAQQRYRFLCQKQTWDRS